MQLGGIELTKKNKEQNQHLPEPETIDQHSLVCNNELFNKDLRAIVNDTMESEE